MNRKCHIPLENQVRKFYNFLKNIKNGFISYKITKVFKVDLEGEVFQPQDILIKISI